jgi:hypothetical protein
VYYPTSWAIYILLGVTLVFAGVLFLGLRQKRLTLKGMVIGAISLLLSLLTVPLLLGFVQWTFFSQPTLAQTTPIQMTPMAGLPMVTPPAGTRASRTAQLNNDLIGDSLLSNVIRWGSAALALVTMYLWYALFYKVTGVERDDFGMGAYLLLYIVASGSSVFFPALSYIFVWPLLFGLIAALSWFFSIAKKVQGMGWLQLLGPLGSAVVAIVLFVPGILIALLSIDIRMIYLVPFFVVALLGFLVAPLEILLDKKQ